MEASTVEAAEQAAAGSDPRRSGAEHVATQRRPLDECLPMLELLNERLAHYLGLGIGEYLNRELTVSTAPPIVERYAYFARRQKVPTHIELVTINPLRGVALVVLEPRMISLVVDILFGGGGRIEDQVTRVDFTPTEQRIIEGLLTTVLSEYARVWSPLCELKPARLRAINNPWLAAVVMPEEQVVTTHFTIDFGEQQTEFAISLPTPLLDPLRDPLLGAEKNLRQPPDPRWRERMANHLQSIEVELRYCLGTASLPLADLLDLRVGDVIALDDAVSPPMAEVAGMPLIACRHGIMRGRYALKIDGLVAPGEDHRLKKPGNTHD